MAPEGADSMRRAILDKALDMGEQADWGAVQLHEVAHALGLTLAEVRAHYEHKDALAEAWFDRADAAMLAMAETPGWLAQTPRQRLYRAICAWLDALAVHRRPTVSMLVYRVHPEHLHLQALGVMRISRTVQWMRDVAMLPEAGWRREVGEAMLTGVFLATLGRWVVEGDGRGEAAKRLLDRLLGLAEKGALAVRPRSWS
jgi:AcrR family transcriptional regulator